MHTFVLTETSCDEVIRVCHQLKPKVSVGIDGILTKLLQCVTDVLAQPLIYMFNLSFNNVVFPTKLKIAKVVPIFKGVDAASLVNFRPVSVLPTISKIIEKLMYMRMMSFAIKHSLPSNCQYGFRSGRNTRCCCRLN